MSPLRWFRKHATWMLIIFGVLLMAIFGLGPVFDNMAQGFQNASMASEDPVIIQYRGGEVTRSKLDELQRGHHASRRFLGGLLEAANKQCVKDGVQLTPLAQIIPPLGRTNNQDALDEQILVRKLLADRAEDEGVVVSDGMIDDYLALLVSPVEFSKSDLKNINKLANQRVPLKSIRDHLRLELKFMQMQRYTSIGVPLNPIPTEAVALYRQANDRIECEVVPVSVEEYVDKVTEEPSRSDLKALFEEGKYEYADGRMQAPGFKIPRKVNVQYFLADMNAFLETEKAKLTDAEIEAEYEKLVAAEDPLVIEVVQEKEPEGFDLNFEDEEESSETESGSSEGSAAGEAMPPAETPVTPGVVPEVQPEVVPEVETETAPATPGETTTIESEASVPVVDVPATEVEAPAIPDPTDLPVETPAVPAPEAGLNIVPKEGAKLLDQSFKVRSTKSQLVAFTQDEPVTSDAATSDAAATKQEVGGIGDLELSDESAGPQNAGENKKTRIKPLSEVADQIRDRLARSAAFKNKTEAAKRASLVMQRYQNEVLRWETSRDKDKKPAPEKPDFQKIADENRLAFAETGLLDPLELRETDIGKVNFLVQVRSPQGPVRNDFQAVSNKIFLEYDRVDELVPQAVDDIMTGNAYTYWTCEKEEVTIPEFSDVEDEIRAYWTHQKAIELAEKAAQEMADKAKANGEKLTAVFPEKAAPTGEFTWFRPGRGAQATYGMPFGVESPGEDFMQASFSLENGEVGVAANESRDTIYVIQRITDGTPVAEIGDEFLSKQYFRFKRIPPDVMGAAQHYAQELELDWRDEFVDSMELKRMK